MPNTPHSSRSVSPLRSGSCRSSCSSMPRFRSGFESNWWAGSEGFCISSISPLFWPELFARGFLDQLFKAVTGRFTVAITGRRGGLRGVSLIVFGFILLESLQDGVLGVVRQERH